MNFTDVLEVKITLLRFLGKTDSPLRINENFKYVFLPYFGFFGGSEDVFQSSPTSKIQNEYQTTITSLKILINLLQKTIIPSVISVSALTSFTVKFIFIGCQNIF